MTLCVLKRNYNGVSFLAISDVCYEHEHPTRYLIEGLNITAYIWKISLCYNQIDTATIEDKM